MRTQGEGLLAEETPALKWIRCAGPFRQRLVSGSRLAADFQISARFGSDRTTYTVSVVRVGTAGRRAAGSRDGGNVSDGHVTLICAPIKLLQSAQLCNARWTRYRILHLKVPHEHTACPSRRSQAQSLLRSQHAHRKLLRPLWQVPRAASSCTRPSSLSHYRSLAPSPSPHPPPSQSPP